MVQKTILERPMRNLILEKRLKLMGAKWLKEGWELPELASTECAEVLYSFYQDLVAVEIVHDNRINAPLNGLFIHSEKVQDAVTIGGWMVAHYNRNFTNIFVDRKISIMHGEFRKIITSDGIACHHSDQITIRMKVGRGSLAYLDSEVEDDHYAYKIL